MIKLIIQALTTIFLGVIVLGVLLFLPAWTFNYWQAWAFIVVFIISTNIIGVYLSVKDPKLLKRRKNVGPKAEKKIYLDARNICKRLNIVLYHTFGKSLITKI